MAFVGDWRERELEINITLNQCAQCRYRLAQVAQHHLDAEYAIWMYEWKEKLYSRYGHREDMQGLSQGYATAMFQQWFKARQCILRAEALGGLIDECNCKNPNITQP